MSRDPGGVRRAGRAPGQGGLESLASLREALRERERREAAQREQEAMRRQAEERERRAFADAVGPVTPVDAGNRRPHDPPSATPEPRQRELDEQAALREAWSDAVDIESLLLTDDGLGYRRDGVPTEVLARLRRGQWSIQGQLDLHGLRRDEAREAVVAFLAGARRQGWRCLRVVHGKGLGSPGREPVLKAKVHRWLAQSDAVIAFAQASGPQGGAGALIVLLGGTQR